MLLILFCVGLALALTTVALWEGWKVIHRRDSHYEPQPRTAAEERRLRRMQKLAAERLRRIAAERTRLRKLKRPEMFHRDWPKHLPRRRRRDE